MLLLPVPPPLNNLFGNNPKGGRYPMPKYKAWKIEAGLRLNTQHPQRFPGCRRLAVRIELPDTCKGDIDGRPKAILDLLVTHGVIDDDRFIDDLHTKRGPRLTDECSVSIWALEMVKPIKSKRAA